VNVAPRGDVLPERGRSRVRRKRRPTPPSIAAVRGPLTLAAPLLPFERYTRLGFSDLLVIAQGR
jgi:hypothetical protein